MLTFFPHDFVLQSFPLFIATFIFIYFIKVELLPLYSRCITNAHSLIIFKWDTV